MAESIARPVPVGGARLAVIAYAVLTYLFFLAVLLLTVLFLADVVLAHTVDRGGPQRSTAQAVVIDAALLGLFAVQHSVMARPWFKRRWTRVVPPAVERSTYVLVASAVLALLLWQWSPVPAAVWTTGGTWRGLLWGLYGVGWLLVVGSTFLINHFELFGLQQAYRRIRGQDQPRPGFVTPLLYRLVRHPLMAGFFIVFWAAPTMTRGRLLFAVLSSAYILLAVRWEEHDLTAELPEYAAYAARTPRFVPTPWRHSGTAATTDAGDHHEQQGNDQPQHRFGGR